jgi:hypothetical protein
MQLEDRSVALLLGELESGRRLQRFQSCITAGRPVQAKNISELRNAGVGVAKPAALRQQRRPPIRIVGD